MHAGLGSMIATRSDGACMTRFNDSGAYLYSSCMVHLFVTSSFTVTLDESS